MNVALMRALFDEVRTEISERNSKNYRMLQADLEEAQEFAESFKAVVEATGQTVATIDRASIDLKKVDSSISFVALTDFYVELLEGNEAILRSYGYGSNDGGDIQKIMLKVATKLEPIDGTAYLFTPADAKVSVKQINGLPAFFRFLVEVQLDNFDTVTPPNDKP